MPTDRPALRALLLVGWALAACPRARAVALAAPFSSRMVLQEGMRVPVWGTGRAGERVSVSFQGQTKTAVVGPKGDWMVGLSPLKPGGPFAMTVRGDRTLTLSDVLVGEVWLFAGQSNMQWPVRLTADAAREIAASGNPRLRLWEEPVNYWKHRRWEASGPETVPEFSAIAYYTGRRLQAQLHVPVGLMVLAVGGTATIEWIPPAARSDPDTERLFERWKAAVAANARSRPGKPGYSRDLAYRQWGRRWEEYVKWCVPFAMRGLVWYQGESTSGVPGVMLGSGYRLLALAWRRLWGEGDFPFIFVQLPTGAAWNPSGARRWRPKQYPSGEWGLHSWERFAEILSLPNTGMAETFDLEIATHPFRKQLFGDRLALQALDVAYGRHLVAAGPIYDRMETEGPRLRLFFKRLGGDLVVRGPRLLGFAVAGADRRWAWARARVVADSVEVWSPEVPHPTAARYGWTYAPRWCNLFNGEGFPALPFRTDDEPPPPEWAPFSRPTSVSAAPRS